MPGNKRRRKREKKRKKGNTEKEERRSVDSTVMNDEFSLFPYQYALEEAGRLTYSPSTTFRATRRVTVLRPLSFSVGIPAAFRYFPHPLPSNERTHERGDILRVEKSAFLNGARSRLRFAVKLPKTKNNESVTWCWDEERGNCGLLFVTVFRIVRNDSPRAVMH